MTGIKGKSVLVLGAGKSGVAAARLLKEKGAGRIVLSDIKTKSKLSEEAAALEKEGIIIETDGHKGDSVLGADLVIVSPGVPLAGGWYETVKRQGKELIGEIEFAYRAASEKSRPRIIAVTGTNGKTTTVSLIYSILNSRPGMRVFLAGNIGLPFCDIVREGKEYEYIVLEISSFQLETIKEFRPYIAVIMNITDDHLDRYPSMQSYAEAKANIFKNQGDDDFLLLNAEDKFTNIMSSMSKSSKVYFSAYRQIEDGYFVQNGKFYKNVFGKKEELFTADGLKLSGSHNYENILAGLITADIIRLDPQKTEKAVKEFNGLPHRIEYSGEINGIKYYNDSKATNIDAAIKAVQSFSDDMALIVGGREKGTDFSGLAAAMGPNVKYVVAFGENADKVQSVFSSGAEILRADNMEEVVRKTSELKDIKLVLFSPGCASFDMFKNYRHRGDEFKKYVGKAANNA